MKLAEYFSTTVKKKKRDNHKQQYNHNVSPTLLPNNIHNNTIRKNNVFENSEGDNEINLVRDQTIFYNQQTTESCSINRSCPNKNKTD